MEAQQRTNTFVDTGEIDLRDMLKIFWISRLSLVIFVFVLTTIAVIYAFTAQTQYRATTLIVISNQDKQNGSTSGLGAALSLVGLSGEAGRDIPQAIVRMKSRAMLEGFIRKEGLLFAIFYDKWDSANRRWALKPGETPPTIHDAYGVLHELLEIQNDDATNVVEVSLLWHDPNQAAAWVNAYINYFNNQTFIEEGRRVSLNERYLTRKMSEANLQSSQDIITALFQRQIADALRLQDPHEFFFKVIEPAYTPEVDELAWPKKKLIVAAGFIASIVLWFVYVMGKFILNPKRQDSDQELTSNPLS